MIRTRIDGRSATELRPIHITLDAYGYAHASVLYEQGGTKVLCGVTLQPGVPPFLKGKRTGWLTAEYAMLPGATQQRTQRDGSQAQRNARSVEISRLIGRCLRPCVDLAALGERTIVVDCDVLQADGSTRVACITAASIALAIAAKRWLQRKMVDRLVVHTNIAAVSVGVTQDGVYTDVSYAEDAQGQADFNLVLTEQGDIVEIQGTAETAPLPWALFDEIRAAAIKAAQDIFQVTHAQLPSEPPTNLQQHTAGSAAATTPSASDKQPLFSLANRINR